MYMYMYMYMYIYIYIRTYISAYIWFVDLKHTFAHKTLGPRSATRATHNIV